MKENRRIELEQMLDEARVTGDQRAVDAVRRTIDRETLECTAHTAERVKRIEASVDEVKSKLAEIADEIRIAKAKLDGAKILAALLKYGAAVGGGSLIVKFFGG